MNLPPNTSEIARNSVWIDTEYPVRPSLQENITADVVIIGGGISGVSTAIALTDQKYSVVLLERDRLASGASGRNAGFLISGTVEYYHRAIDFIGHHAAKRFWELSEENHTVLAAWISEFEIQCDYQQRGSLVLANSPEEYEEQKKAVAALETDHFFAELIQPSQITEWGLPKDRYCGGFYSPADGAVNPVQLTQGLGRVAELNRIRIYEQSPVVNISETREGTVRIQTPDGVVESQVAILATNAYTPLLHNILEGKVIPVRGQMLATEPTDRLVDVPCYANFGFDYFRQLPNGRLIIGGSRDVNPDAEVGYKEDPTEAVQQELERYLHSIIGSGKLPAITHRWAGIMGFARDGLPILGRIPSRQNVYVVAGFTGHGMGIATRMAEIMAALVTDGWHPDFPLVSIRRFLK